MRWSEFKIQKGSNSSMVEKYESTEIECPICGRFIYRRTDIIFTTYPPKYQYECLQCGWTDYAQENSMNKQLIRDMENMEQIMSRTGERADIWQDRFIYHIALAIYDILKWIYREEQQRTHS